MLAPLSYRKLAELYHRNKYATELFLRLISDYDLTTYKVIPRKVIFQNYRLRGSRLLYAIRGLQLNSLLEIGPLVKYNGGKVRTMRIHPSALVTTESLENFLIETAEREQRLKVAPLMSKPAKIRPPKGKPTPKPVFPRKKLSQKYTPPEVSVFDRLKPFYKEPF